MSKPNHLPDFDVDDLSAHVSGGQYRRWDSPSEVPEELQDWASYPSTEEFRGLSLCASSTSHNLPRLGGVNVPSSATVYWIRTVRYDAAEKEPHFNADDRFVFESSNGEAFQVSRHDHPEHFQPLSEDTGFEAAVESGQLPPQDGGPLSDFSGTVSFST